jgi:hypothetical protein
MPARITYERRNTMSEDTKKVEKTKPETLAAELSEQDLNKVAGGFTKILVE